MATQNLILAFPGSGSQYSGMARKLLEEHAVVRETFEEASDILNRDLTQLCSAGSVVSLNRTENVLVSIFVTSVAQFRLFKQLVDKKPSAMIGHSLGEYTALTCSGALSFEEGLKLVAFRSEIAAQVARQYDTCTSIVKGSKLEIVERALKQVNSDLTSVWLACKNSDHQFMLSGLTDGVVDAEQAVLDLDPSAQIVPIFGGAPYHSELMLPHAPSLKSELTKCHWMTSCCAVMSNVYGRPYQSQQDIITGLAEQLFRTVDWQKCIYYIQQNIPGEVIEIGPQSVIKHLLIESEFKNRVFSFDDPMDRKRLTDRSFAQSSSVDHKRQMIDAFIRLAMSTRNKSENNDNLIAALLSDLFKLTDAIRVGRTELNEKSLQELKAILVNLFKAKDTSSKEVAELLEELDDLSIYVTNAEAITL